MKWYPLENLDLEVGKEVSGEIRVRKQSSSKELVVDEDGKALVYMPIKKRTSKVSATSLYERAETEANIPRRFEQIRQVILDSFTPEEIKNFPPVIRLQLLRICMQVPLEREQADTGMSACEYAELEGALDGYEKR